VNKRGVKPANPVQKAALNAIFADIAELRATWTYLVENPTDDAAVRDITRLVESLRRWVSMYRAAGR